MTQHILVGVSSSVAAFKTVQLVSNLLKKGYTVDVIMTENATKFIQPLSFSSLTHRPVYIDTFIHEESQKIMHIELAKAADLFIVAPATANIIAKLAHGLADDMLSTTFLACTAAKIIAPAMNTDMLYNSITQKNLETLRQHDIHILDTQSGLLACLDVGEGKLASIEVMEAAIEEVLNHDQPLAGKSVLISAGPTQEALDPVRFITNHSSGKMGYALARQARKLGAAVTLVSGPVSLEKPRNIDVIDVISAQDMYQAMLKAAPRADIIIMSAAVADYTFINPASNKLKKDNQKLSLELEKTPDILKYLGEHKKDNQVLIGFAMETENALENARHKKATKNCDLLVLNDLTQAGAGFKVDTNIVTLIGVTEKSLPLMSKDQLAQIILQEALSINNA